MIRIFVPRTIKIQYGWDMIDWLDDNVGRRDISSTPMTWNFNTEGDYFVFEISDKHATMATIFKLRFI